MDFYRINAIDKSKDKVEVCPEYIVKKSDDLMIKGNKFYMAYDKDTGLWSPDKLIIQKAVDHDIDAAIEYLKENVDPYKLYTPKYLGDFSNNHWASFDRYISSLPDNYKPMDSKVTFFGDEIKKKDYVSKHLSYALSDAPCPAWETIVSKLYDPEEREKIEWAIGAILSGEAKKIQKFIVFYGKQGSGKSTILNIVMKLFDGYYATFKAENLVHNNDQFGLKFLSSNPLVAIDEDTNLRKIETNATLNKISSHEEIEINEKFKAQYVIKPACMMMLATNKSVQITDAKSGIIRRLIDIEPNGNKIEPESRYFELMEQIDDELGAIANRCLKVFAEKKKYYYSDYIPVRMMYRTNAIFNFVQETIYPLMKNQRDAILNGEELDEGISENNAWAMWKNYCQQSGIEYTQKRFEFVDELGNYFEEHFKTKRMKDSTQIRNWLKGFRFAQFETDDNVSEPTKNVIKSESPKLKEKLDQKYQEEAEKKEVKDDKAYSYGWLNLNCTKSLLDDVLAEYPAQYETNDPEHPLKYTWKNVKTKLKSLDTTKTHYVKGPGQLIFVDFDMHGKDGKKDLQLNLKAAGSTKWKPTYVELSNSGGGIHSYYWYDGDVSELSSVFDNEIEIKAFPEDQLRSMRRRVSRCNDLPIAHISSGLPLKEKKVINWDGLKDEKHLRNLIIQAIKKEIRPYGEEPKTITCTKYIRDVLKDAQDSGMSYDIRDLDEAVYAFAAHSHNNKEECTNIYYGMEFKWPKEVNEPVGNILNDTHNEEAPIIILDCEVVRNLLLVVYKELGPEHKCIRLFNPKPHEIEKLMNMRIVGHNVVGYDNNILYAAWFGWNNEQIFQLSQDIIVNGNRSPFREAKNLSYTDTLDVASEKKGLKKIEIEMHIPHKEMEIDWSKPLPESEWERLAQYCENDVLATEAYFMSKKWQTDFKARKILATLTGMTVNDSTNNLSAQLIFGDVKEPWHDFVYPDLKAMFPEYRFEYGKSYYGDELIGEGGRVYAEPGMYYDVITFDVASMHPTSIISENGFGPYTQHYKDLYEARIAIKHKDYDKARSLFGGRLAPFLTTDEDADDLAYALKIVLNSVYGMTAASFQNRFRDPRNKDNWVAKRGALFMEKLRREVQAMGGHVIHIKTDSIKLVHPSKKLQDFVISFGKKYGYTFEIESHYERICLVNHAVYIALRDMDDPDWLKECRKTREKAEKDKKEYVEPTRWTATGAQFAHPYVFKRLFSHEAMEFWDFCETKTVKTSLYLDLNEDLKDVRAEEKERDKILKRIKALKKALDTNNHPGPELTDLDKEKINTEIADLQKDISVLDEIISEGHAYTFVGKAGEFMPIKDGFGGGLLMRKETDGSYGYATGAKGFRWLESESVHELKDWKSHIDLRYFRGLVDTAIETIGKYGDFSLFVRGDPDDEVIDYNTDPWMLPCGSEEYAYCSDCPNFSNNDNTYGYCCKLGYNIENQILGEK